MIQNNVCYYTIKYGDDDEKELSQKEVEKRIDRPNIKLSSTDQQEQVEYEYWTAQQSCRRQSPQIEKLKTKYAKEWANAVNLISEKWYCNINDSSVNQEYKNQANAVINEETEKKIEYQHLIHHKKYRDNWLKSAAKEFYTLFQGSKKDKHGNQKIKGTNTLFWINKNQVPENKKVTYARIVCSVRPKKEDPNHTRITAGGDRLEYLGDVSTETAGLTTAKMLFNSVVSTPDAKFCTFDISNMYLNTPLDDYQYMRFNVKDVPPEVIDLYNLHDKITPDGWLYCKIRRAIYGLKEAGKLANIQLQKVLATEGYYPCPFTQGFFCHETRDITFSLVVDNFGVKYTNRKDAEHLESVIKKNYPMKTNWDGDYYLGMTVKYATVLIA